MITRKYWILRKCFYSYVNASFLVILTNCSANKQLYKQRFIVDKSHNRHILVYKRCQLPKNSSHFLRTQRFTYERRRI